MRQRQPRRHDKAHLEFVRQLPCMACGDDIGSEAAHIRFPDRRAAKPKCGLGEKPDDAWVVPLCRRCHHQQHGMSERAFWNNAGIDPIFIALALRNMSGDIDAGCLIVKLAKI